MKKLSLLFTLTLAALCTSGCDLLDLALDDSTTPTNQQQNSNEDNKPQEGSENGSGEESENNSGEEGNGQEGENQEGHKEEGGENQEENNEQGEEEQEHPIEEKPVVSIELEETGQTFLVGDDTYSIEYTVLPAEVDQHVTFKSNDESVATVDEDGYITALSEGNTFITLTSVADPNASATFVISVYEEEEQVVDFSVSFYANGGSGFMDDDITTGSMYVVPRCEFYLYDHEFVGWALNEPSGEIYSTGDVIHNIDDDIDLYAVWKETPPPVIENYRVTFNANGGTGTMAQQLTTGSSYVVPQCAFIYEEHTFNGWALNSPFGTKYNAGTTISSISADITLYATWELDNPDPDDYYAKISDSLTGDALLKALISLNKEKRKSTVGYSAMGTSPSGQFKYTDYDPETVQYDSNGQPYGTKLISFYSGKSSSSGLNREHVWPKSHGGNLVESDIHMPRPTLTAENGSRGNSFYVEGMCHSSNGWDPAMEDFGVESYRGDSARIIFYCCIADSKLTLTELTYHSTSNSNRDNLMGKLSDMLKWNLNYPVLDREQRRNSGAEYLQGNRNPFIDHPEYACKIWGSTNEATKSVCGIK